MRLYFSKGNYRGNLLHLYTESYCNVVPCPAAKICGRNEKFLDTKAVVVWVQGLTLISQLHIKGNDHFRIAVAL